MKRASKNERKVKKDKTNRRKEGKEKDKDIHLNVVGVPTTNVNVNKTAQRQQEKDYHLYKISIDTTRKEKERQRKRHVSTTKPLKGQAKDNRASPIVTRSDTSSTESELYRSSRHLGNVVSEFEPLFSTKQSAVNDKQDEKILSQKLPGKMGRNVERSSSEIAVVRHKSNESNPDVCFTTSDENKRKVRIVGSKKERSHDFPRKTKLSFSSNSTPQKQVGFAELDAVYGTTPEGSSQESDFDLPYKKTSPQVYQIQNTVPPDAFYKESIKFDILPGSIDSPKIDRNGLARHQLVRKSDLPLEDWQPKQMPLTSPTQQHQVLNVTGVPIERSFPFDSNLMPPKADRKHLTNEKPRSMTLEQSPISGRETWDEPFFESTHSSPSTLIKDIQIDPGNTRGMVSSNERPSTIFNKSYKRVMSPKVEERGGPFQPSATHQYLPELSKIDQRPVTVDEDTLSKRQKVTSPSINNLKPTVISEIVQVPNKTGLDRYKTQEKNIPYQSSSSKLQGTSSKSQDIAKKLPDGLRDNEEYLLTKPRNNTNDSLYENLNVHEYPRLQNANTSKPFQEPSRSVSGYQTSNPYVMSASEKGTDTSDLYGPFHKKQKEKQVLSPVRSPDVISETTTNLKAKNALPLEDKSTNSQFDASEPSITRNKEDEKDQTINGDSYRSDKRPLTVDRELMTEIIPNKINGSVSRMSKTRSKVLYPKIPSKELYKHGVEREKMSLRKYQNSSLVSTIPKPSFRESKSPILTEKHEQTEGDLRKADETFKVKTKPLPLQKPPMKRKKPEVGLETSLPLERSNLIQSNIIPESGMHDPGFKYNQFPICSDSFAQNKLNEINTMTPYSDLVDSVPGKAVDSSIFHTDKQSSLLKKPSDDTSIEISHRTYGDRSSVGTAEAPGVSSLISSKVLHDTSVNELIPSAVLESVYKEKIPSYFENVDVDGNYGSVAPVKETFDADTVNIAKEGRSPGYYNKLSSFVGKLGQKQKIQMDSNYFQADRSKGSLRGELSNRRKEHLRPSIISVPVIETIQEVDNDEEAATPLRRQSSKLNHSAKTTIESGNISENMYKDTTGRMTAQQSPETQRLDRGSSEYLKEPYTFERFDQTFNKPEILAYHGDVVDRNPFEYDKYSNDSHHLPEERLPDEGLDDPRDTQPIHESEINADVYKRYESRRPPHKNENIYMNTNPGVFERPIKQPQDVRRDKTVPERYSITNSTFPRSASNTSKDLQGTYTEKSLQMPKGMAYGSEINEETYPSTVIANEGEIYTVAASKRRPIDTNIPRGIKEKNKHKSSTEQTNIFGRSPTVEAVYVGRIPNSTLNVFFTPDATNMQSTNLISDDNFSEMQLPRVKSAKLISEGPKGILIFVNKKTDPGKDPFGDPHRLNGSGTPDSEKRKSSYGRRSSPVRESASSKASRKHHKIVQKSPSERKITEKYPCGCVRITTKNSNGELTAEELISAFCQYGSKCEVRHPKLQRAHRLISLDESLKKISLENEDVKKYSSEKQQFPEIEVIAAGVVSRKPIKPKPPSPTMKGANYTCTLNVKSDKFNGVCNFYIEDRLKDYIRDNLDVIKGLLETKHEPKQLKE